MNDTAMALLFRRRRWSVVAALGLAVLLVSETTRVEAGGPFDDSIVRVIATIRAPNVVQPWTKASPTEVSGTGFVIADRQLLTNAHVVEYASQIYIQPNKSSDKFEAKVQVLAPEIDLAVLTLADETFFANRPSIPVLADMPKVRSQVNVYGYPIGGEQISVTEGIVSRMDYTRLPRGASALRVQIDAALNPGNSGGPAISDGKLVGVAFQMLQQAENIGYLIAAEEVTMFLDDVRDGRYDGKPQFYGELQTVENEALRAWLKLPRGVGGAFVTRVPRTAANYPLRLGDVVTKIGDHPLDQAGKVRVADELTLPFAYLTPRLTKDNLLPLTVLRQGQEVKVQLPVMPTTMEVVPSLRGTYPRYFILGPLVFSVATREFFTGVGARMGGVLMARSNPVFTRLVDEPAFPGEELVVVASPMLSHRIAKGYSQPFACVVQSLNGTAVKNLRHLVELIRDAKGEFLEIEFADRFTERYVFRRAEILGATDEILTDNGIRNPYSEDLAAVWEKK